jgi:hypothetical protein
VSQKTMKSWQVGMPHPVTFVPDKVQVVEAADITLVKANLVLCPVVGYECDEHYPSQHCLLLKSFEREIKRQIYVPDILNLQSYFTFHSDGLTLTSQSSVRRIPSTRPTLGAQPSTLRAFDASTTARDASKVTA